MSTILRPQGEAQAQPRPSTCPVCGLSADNGISVYSELTTTSTFVDTSGHMWSVTWMAVA